MIKEAILKVYKNENLTCSLGGGGRYNKIITDFMNNGESYPAYIHVYDEKVSNKDNFQKQRLRWMTAQIQSLFMQLPYLPYAIKTGNIDYINKTIQQALIPRSMLIVFAFVFSVLMTMISRTWCIKWWCLFLAICISLYLAIPKQLRSHTVFGKIMSVPTLVWKMVQNIPKISRKSSDFIHTSHDK